MHIKSHIYTIIYTIIYIALLQFDLVKCSRMTLTHAPTSTSYDPQSTRVLMLSSGTWAPGYAPNTAKTTLHKLEVQRSLALLSLDLIPFLALCYHHAPHHYRRPLRNAKPHCKPTHATNVAGSEYVVYVCVCARLLCLVCGQRRMIVLGTLYLYAHPNQYLQQRNTRQRVHFIMYRIHVVYTHVCYIRTMLHKCSL